MPQGIQGTGYRSVGPTSYCSEIALRWQIYFPFSSTLTWKLVFFPKTYYRTEIQHPTLNSVFVHNILKFRRYTLIFRFYVANHLICHRPWNAQQAWAVDMVSQPQSSIRGSLFSLKAVTRNVSSGRNVQTSPIIVFCVKSLSPIRTNFTFTRYSDFDASFSMKFS